MVQLWHCTISPCRAGKKGIREVEGEGGKESKKGRRLKSCSNHCLFDTQRHLVWLPESDQQSWSGITTKS